MLKQVRIINAYPILLHFLILFPFIYLLSGSSDMRQAKKDNKISLPIIQFCLLFNFHIILNQLKIQATLNYGLDNQNMFKKQNTPILSVRADPSKGLEFMWNFAGIQPSNIERYHILVFVGRQSKHIQAFYRNYYTHMKNGQLFGVFTMYSSIYERRGKIVWQQKLGLNPMPPNFKAYYLLEIIDQYVINSLVEHVNKKRGLIVANFVFSHIEGQKNRLVKSINNLQKYITKLRINKSSSDKIVFNLVSSYFKYSTVDSNFGINMFSLDTISPSNTCQQILCYVGSVLIKSLTVTLETKQKYNILFCSNKQWEVSDGCEIWKKYYALPKINFNQFLIFMEINVAENNKEGQLLFDMSMSYTFFDQKQIRDRKKIVVEQIQRDDCKNGSNYIQTINDNSQISKYKIYQFSKDIFLYTNLTKQSTYILLSQIQVQSDKVKGNVKNKNKGKQISYKL